MDKVEQILNFGSGRFLLSAGVALGLMLAGAPLEASASGRKGEDAAKSVLTPETQLSLARRLEVRGDTETALGLYQRVLIENPNNEDALRGLVGLAVQTGRAGAVHDEAVRLASKRPKDAEAQLWLAASLNENGRPADALAVLEAAEKAGSVPSPSQLWVQRGIARDMLGDHLEAQRAFSNAVTLNPSDGQAPLRLALSLALQEDYPAALRILQMQVNDPLMERPVRETLAIIYALSGQTEQAVEIARTASGSALVDSQRGYLERLPTLSAPGKAYAAHFRRISESLENAAPATPAAPAPAPVPAPQPAPEPAPAPASAPAPEPQPEPEPQPQPEPQPEPAAPQATAAPEAVPAAAPAETPAPPKAAVSGAGYWLQLASLISREKAHAAWADATAKAATLLKGRQPFLQLHVQENVTYHRLLIGPFDTLAAAREAMARLGAKGIKPVIKRDVGAIEPLKP